MTPIRRAQESYEAACRLFSNPYDHKWLLGVLGEYDPELLARELASFYEYWSDQSKRPKSVKRAIRNWLGKVVGADKGDAAERPVVPAADPVPGAVFTAREPDRASAALWGAAMVYLRATMDQHTLSTWFSTARPISVENGVLTLWVPNEMTRDVVATSTAVRKALPTGTDYRVVTG